MPPKMHTYAQMTSVYFMNVGAFAMIIAQAADGLSKVRTFRLPAEDLEAGRCME